jgi:hypothetical protein
MMDKNALRGAQSCCQPGCCSEPSNHNQQKRKLTIDFLYLDLNVCVPCQGADGSLDEAVADVATDLETTGITLETNKIHITSAEQAIEYKFYSSPTIRINGRDIQLETKEALCESCGDLCGDEVDCRIWLYQGKEYTVPPKAMLVEAILREVYGNATSAPANEQYVLPENLKKFFSSMEKKAANQCDCRSNCKC